MSGGELSLEGFAAIAEQAGLRLEPDELPLMRAGYLGLQAMLDRLDRPLDAAAEPALTFPCRRDA